MPARTSPAPSSLEPIDGRRQRAQITRQNIVSACIALQNEGVLRPSLQQIAERARVSMRTLFQHFPEKDQLTRAVLDKLTPNELAKVPTLAQHGAIEARISQFLDARVQLLETMSPHRRASNAMIETSPLLKRHRLRVRKHFRNVVEAWFAIELDRLPRSMRSRWLVAIATLADWEMWQSLRTYPNRSIPEAKESLRLLLTAALHDMKGEMLPRRD